MKYKIILIITIMCIAVFVFALEIHHSIKKNDKAVRTPENTGVIDSAELSENAEVIDSAELSENAEVIDSTEYKGYKIAMIACEYDEVTGIGICKFRITNIRECDKNGMVYDKILGNYIYKQSVR